MKFSREAVAWFIIFIVAAISGVLFTLFVQPEFADFAAARPSLFDTAPAFFATIALASFFLLIRFFIKKGKPGPRTEIRHIGIALLLSLSVLAAWELIHLFLKDSFRYFPARLLGGFLACLLVVLLWMIIRAWVKEKENKASSSSPEA